MVVGSSPTVGVAAEPTQSLSSVNLQTMHPLKNAGTADWSCLGSFSDPHQTRTNIWKRLLKIFSESGVAQWLACWAHNPKVPGIETRLRYACTHSGLASPLPRSLLHIAQPVFAGTCAIFTAMSGGKKSPNNKGGRSRARETGERKKDRGEKGTKLAKKNKRKGKRNARTEAEKKQQNEGKKTKKSKREQNKDRQGNKQQNERKRNKKRQKTRKKGQNEGKRSKRNESRTKGKETGTKRNKATEKA